MDRILELPVGTKFSVVGPVVKGRKGEYGKLFEELKREGFMRVRVDKDMRTLDEDIVLDKKYKHDIAVVVDRLVIREGVRTRLADSVDTSLKWGGNRLAVLRSSSAIIEPKYSATSGIWSAMVMLGYELKMSGCRLA